MAPGADAPVPMSGDPRRRRGRPRARLTEVDHRVEMFRRQADEFVRSIAEIAGLGESGDPHLEAQANLEVARTVFSKWSSEILVTLFSMRPVGFEGIRSHLRGISPRVLSAKLKVLEEQGLVYRRVLTQRPPRVRYGLTTAGVAVVHLAAPMLMYLRYRTQQRFGVAIAGVRVPDSATTDGSEASAT